MKTARGFTLVEMAIVLVIVGLLLGGLLMPLSAQVEQRRISETQKALDEIKEALIGFAIANRYLPCPAVSATDGSEGPRVAGQCNPRVGFIPWGALGTSKLDSWNHIFRYSVTPAYTNNTTFFSLPPPSRDITIQTRDSLGNLINLSNANDIPAVIMSHGKNGLLGTTDTGVLIANTSATNTDEVTNANVAGTSFVNRIMNENTAAPGGEFDDIVVWISPNILFNRMVSAQKLP